MRKTWLITLLLSSSLAAKTYVVNHRGHVYKFIAESGLELESEKIKLSMASKECSRNVREDLQNYFKSLLSPRIIDPKNAAGLIRITEDETTFYVSDSHKNGVGIQRFPDTFLKSYLVQKELCLPRKP